MAKKGPKTMLGSARKLLTGDGRKDLETAARESFEGKRKKR